MRPDVEYDNRDGAADSKRRRQAVPAAVAFLIVRGPAGADPRKDDQTMYRYEPDPAKRPALRDAAAVARHAKLPAKIRKLIRSAPASGATEDNLPTLLRTIADTVHVFATASLNPGDETTTYEAAADRALADAQRAESMVDSAKVKATPYGDLDARVRLVLVKVRRRMTAIEDHAGAHLLRSCGREPDSNFWRAMFAEAEADVCNDLVYLADAITAAPSAARPAATKPEKGLNPTQKKALDYIREHGPIDGKDLAKAIGIEFESLRTHIIPPLKRHGVYNHRNGEGYSLRPM